MFLSY